MGRQIGVAHEGPDAEPALVRRLDLVEPEAIHVDEVRGSFDLQLHQIEQIRSARDELRAIVTSRRRRSFRRRTRAFVGEGFHPLLPATSEIASAMLEYAPQRQMLPLIRSRSSGPVSCDGAIKSRVAWLGMPALISPSIATAEQICPGVQ